MNKEQINLMMDYYTKLEKFITEYDDIFYGESDEKIFAFLHEILKVYEDEFCDVAEKLNFQKNNSIPDAKILLGIMKKYLADHGVGTSINEDKKILKFITSIETFHERVLPNEDILNCEYVTYDNWNGGTYYLAVDFQKEYNLIYGENFNNNLSSIEDVIKYVELFYLKIIKSDKRYKYTVELNNTFSRFMLPYRLENGKVIKKGFRTTSVVNDVICDERFEKRIRYAEEMILKEGLMDKKSALENIVAALQYLLDVQPGKTKKEQYKSATKLFNDDTTKVYSVINCEIDYVLKMVNEYFVIRHNEVYNTRNEIREPLGDSLFIEYLYNRIYSLVQAIKIKYIKSKKQTIN